MTTLFLFTLLAILTNLVCYFVIGLLLLLFYRIVIKDYFDSMSMYGWLLWPDVDVKFLGGKEFVEKYTNRRFSKYIIFFWWVRLLRIFGIFAYRFFGLVFIAFSIIYLLTYDLVDFVKKRYSHDLPKSV